MYFSDYFHEVLRVTCVKASFFKYFHLFLAADINTYSISNGAAYCHFHITVNSDYSGHPRDHDLVSVIVGCEKIFLLSHIYTRGSHVCSFSLTPVLFSDSLLQVKSVRTLLKNTTELNRTGDTYPLCTVVLLST